MDIVETHNRLTNKIEEYIGIILKEYGNYMNPDIKEKISNITDYSKILQIYDFGDVSAYATSENVVMPLCADKILNKASRIPGYGINKNHLPYNDKTMVINNNTFLSYLIHVFISGTNAEGYYADLLLHEVMHYCGSDGGSVLDEGTNELLTRMLAQKYNLRTNSCGYPKEVKLVYELMQILGEETIKRLSFLKRYDQKIEYLMLKHGEEIAKLYDQVRSVAEKEFYDKYYSHIREFNGVVGIAKK